MVAAYEGEGGAPTVNDDVGLPVGEWGRVGISIHRSDPRIVYASIEQGWRFNASTAYVERRAGTYRSEDRGETWEHMSDFNPRPMYASQPLVDPNDDQRIYHMNFFAASDDGGRTFESLDQSLHGDDRILWINPDDSRHLIKGDDGGVGISYDRAKTWLYVTNLPLSQFYRVRVDDQTPYNVYGGLQDNGSWIGPSETYRSEGILNEDWTRLGGGDGFLATPDRTDPDRVYAESQYLGLTRLDMRTGERQDIRPGDPTGHIGPRRNFDAWFERQPEPELFKAMEPANWDGPYIISPHDPNTLYAGTDELWVSHDRGESWRSLGDLTSGVDRRDLPIMGELPHDTIPSLDDGIPYWPTASVVNESPLAEGLLFVGTDDGRLLVSRDGGRSMDDVSAAMPGLPPLAYLSWVEPSRHRAERVYAVVNNYRNDDYGNYVYRSDDGGRSWRRIDGGLPPERVARTLREDPRDADVLYLGTELGLFLSTDGGQRWLELRGNMPTLPFNDLVVQERENDLVLGTHGRGVWILDQINALQELNDVPAGASFHVFTLEPARQIRYWSEKAHQGDMFYRGENPPRGAMVDYWLDGARDEDDVTVSVLAADGGLVRTLSDPPRRAGLNRAVWDLRHESLEGPERSSRPMRGPLVVPGRYTVRVTVDGRSQDRTVQVMEDPRIEVAPEVRRRWTEDQRRVGALYERVADQVDRLAPFVRRVREQSDTTRAEDAPAADAAEARTPERAAERAAVENLPRLDEAVVEEVRATAELVDELLSRVGRLYSDVGAWTGPMTADQASREAYYRDRLAEFEGRVSAVVGRGDGG
ncbi:MAG: hypothetical protein KY453_09015 [Gemmatimonadetes bacterium]|nr:hypothetical protein [Gemmatimonadota bacterium]